MKIGKYLEVKEVILEYLKLERHFCFRKNIIRDLVRIKGLKKTRVSLTLRRMRKEKSIRLYRGRWGLK